MSADTLALAHRGKDLVSMQAAAPGLRERKKAETRAALRAAAVRLFLERGPAAVTVSDICEAAGVSARTFFNYFDAKEEALLPWDKHLIEEVITALAARPAAEPPLTAVRQAIEQVLLSFTASAGWQAGDRVLTAYPELRAATADGMIRNQGRLADALAKRAGQAGGSLYPQLLAGAAASAFRAAFSVWALETGTAGLQALVGEAFDRLAAGLPPSRSDPAGAAGCPLAGEAGDGQITPAGQRLATPSSPRLTCKERQWARGYGYFRAVSRDRIACRAPGTRPRTATDSLPGIPRPT